MLLLSLIFFMKCINYAFSLYLHTSSSKLILSLHKFMHTLFLVGDSNTIGPHFSPDVADSVIEIYLIGIGISLVYV